MLNRFEKFILNITEIDLYWHRLATSVMKEHGLKGNYAVYFTALKNSEEGLTSSELSSICGKDKADVSRDLKVLEQAELVQRIQRGQSRYRARILLTEKGMELTKEIATQAEKAVSCIGADIKEEDREIFYQVLDQINANMKELSKTGIPS